MADIDAHTLASQLEERFCLRFSGDVEEVDGGQFAVVRPADLEKGNGFGIIIGRTPRRVEASFRADRFSGELLRLMACAEEEAWNLFISLLDDARNRGIRVIASIDDRPLASVGDLGRHDWSRLEVDCDKRLPLGIVNANDINKEAFDVAAVCAGLILSLLPMEDTREAPPLFEGGLPEGACMRVEVNRYERNRSNRAACIAHHGDSCTVCGFNFGKVYGDHGRGFIEVHHKVPVSAMGGAYRISPIEDLIPVCPNCHAMLHRTDPPMTLNELRTLLIQPINK